MIFRYIILLCLLILAPQGLYGIKCYQCTGEDNLCTVGLLGEKTECPPSTTSCYKSWTVETSPLTKRKCADDRVYPNECRDVLFGQTSMLACFCSNEDFCNSTPAALQTTMPALVIISTVLSLFFCGAANLFYA